MSPPTPPPPRLTPDFQKAETFPLLLYIQSSSLRIACVSTTCLLSYRLYKWLFSTVVNKATGDSSSANDSSPLFPPLAAIQAQLRMTTKENSGLTVNGVPGAMMKVPFDQYTVPNLLLN